MRPRQEGSEKAITHLMYAFIGTAIVVPLHGQLDLIANKRIYRNTTILCCTCLFWWAITVGVPPLDKTARIIEAATLVPTLV